MKVKQQSPENVDNSVFYEGIIVSDETKGYVKQMANNANKPMTNPGIVRRRPKTV